MRSAYRRIDRFEEEQRIRRHRVYRLRVVLACHAFGWATTNGMFGSYAAETFDPRQTGAAFVAYLILTAFMTIGALRTTKVLFFIFLAIDFLFVGLALSAFGVAREATHMLAAISELVISLLSFYCAGANILNNHFGEQFLSLGNPFWSKKS